MRWPSIPFAILMVAGIMCQDSTGIAADLPEKAESDRKELLAGVSSIAFTGVPGEILVFGEQAFPVVSATASGRPGVYIAAARIGKGRVIALGHPGVLNEPDVGDTARFFENAMAWLTASRRRTTPSRVAIREGDRLIEHLRGKGFQAVPIVGKDWSKSLREVDIVCLPIFREEPAVLRGLEAFVENGGGLIVGSLGWAWQGYHARERERLDRDAAANRLCAPFGLSFASGTLSNPAGNKILAITPLRTETLHVGPAVTELARRLRTSDTNGGEPSTPTRTELALLAQRAMGSLPATASLRTQILDLAVQHENKADPVTRQQPARPGDDLRKAICVLESIAALHAPVEKLSAAPSSHDFPGSIPPDAPRVSDEEVAISTNVAGWRGGSGPIWQSTGLYAPPGEAIEVVIPIEATAWGLSVQIGCHTDSIDHHDNWFRPPLITRQFELASQTTKAGSGYGGLIYILVPPGKPRGDVPVRITGAVRAPTFVQGQTDVSDWRFGIRDFPAPFGELVCDRIILTVQSSDLRKLDSPERLIEQWTKIVDCYADLAGLPLERGCPERIVPDHQISAGWLHSGYPIMAQDIDRWSGRLVGDQFVFSEGEWGFFHELGHNHQDPLWTFEGTTEVTCNVFGLYVLDTLYKGSRPHAEVQPDVQARKEREYIAAGRPFNVWKSDPFLALIMYEQLSDGFGWEPYQLAFREYRSLPDDSRPKTDEQKRDQWLIQMSRATKRNLGPFFRHWGIPVSEAALDEVRALPEWMPEKRQP